MYPLKGDQLDWMVFGGFTHRFTRSCLIRCFLLKDPRLNGPNESLRSVPGSEGPVPSAKGNWRQHVRWSPEFPARPWMILNEGPFGADHLGGDVSTNGPTTSHFFGGSLLKFKPISVQPGARGESWLALCSEL